MVGAKVLIYEFNEFGTDFGLDGLAEWGVVVGAFWYSVLFVINWCWFVLEGAEMCDLVGLFILDKITCMVGFGNISLYRDDGCNMIKQTSSTLRESLKKKSS